MSEPIYHRLRTWNAPEVDLYLAIAHVAPRHSLMQMAEAAQGEPAYNRSKRMEAAWLALVEEQDWLDGELSPMDPVKRAKEK